MTSDLQPLVNATSFQPCGKLKEYGVLMQLHYIPYFYFTEGL